MARDVGLTFAGGGNRALVQVGLLRRWWQRLEPRVAAVASCSAGASMAVSLLTGREAEATAYWFGRRAGVERRAAAQFPIGMGAGLARERGRLG